MQEKQILEHTKQALDAIAPDCFDAIWDASEHAKKEDYPLPSPQKHTRASRRWITGLSVACACMLCVLGIQWYQRIYTIYTTINIDVNPSICICVNRNNEVLSIEGLNNDGEQIVDIVNITKRQDLDSVVKQTMQAFVTTGYLTTENKNAILISVDTPDTKVADTMQTQLSNEISLVMTDQQLSGNIVSQNMATDDADIKQLSEELSISEGKATFIHNIAKKDRSISKQKLAGMKIDEIVATAENTNMDFADLDQPARVKSIHRDKSTPLPVASQTPGPTAKSNLAGKQKEESQSKTQEPKISPSAPSTPTVQPPKEQTQHVIVPKEPDKAKTTRTPKTTQIPRVTHSTRGPQQEDSPVRVTQAPNIHQPDTDHGAHRATERPAVTLQPQVTDKEYTTPTVASSIPTATANVAATKEPNENTSPFNDHFDHRHTTDEDFSDNGSKQPHNIPIFIPK